MNESVLSETENKFIKIQCRNPQKQMCFFLESGSPVLSDMPKEESLYKIAKQQDVKKRY